MLSYCGVNLLCQHGPLADWISSNLPVEETLSFEWRTFPGARLTGLTWPGSQLPRTVKLSTLYWPRGASRFSVGWFLVSSSQLKKIRLKTTNQGSPVPQPLVLTQYDPSGVLIATVSVNLYMLPPRCLDLVAPGANGLHLITLVDARYWWRQQNTGNLVVTPGTTTWADLYAALSAQFGIGIEIDPINANYLYPDASLSAQYESCELLLDAVAYNCGQRIVANLDGTFSANNITTAQAAVTAQLRAFSQQTPRYVKAGRPYAFSYPSPIVPAPSPPNDLPAQVPASVVVAMQQVNGSGVLQPRYPVNVSLGSLGLTQFTGVTGSPTAKTFHDTAVYQAGTNNATIAALAQQVASDFCQWSASPMAQKYNGIVPWDPEGLSDYVEWTYRSDSVRGPAEVSTMVIRGPLNDLTDELMHYAGVAIPPPVIGGVMYWGAITYTSVAGSVSEGTQTVEPDSMNGIFNGANYYFGTGSNQELITASNVMTDSFEATFTTGHPAGSWMAGGPTTVGGVSYYYPGTVSVEDGTTQEMSFVSNVWLTEPNGIPPGPNVSYDVELTTGTVSGLQVYGIVDIVPIFPVQITAVTESSLPGMTFDTIKTTFDEMEMPFSGWNVYTWTEQVRDDSSGSYYDLPAGRTGDSTSCPLLEINNVDIPGLPVLAWAKYSATVNDDFVYEITNPDEGIGVEVAEALIGVEPNIDFDKGGNITITGTNDPTNDRVKVKITDYPSGGYTKLTVVTSITFNATTCVLTTTTQTICIPTAFLNETCPTS
jgi:hypothetical protein